MAEREQPPVITAENRERVAAQRVTTERRLGDPFEAALVDAVDLVRLIHEGAPAAADVVLDGAPILEYDRVPLVVVHVPADRGDVVLLWCLHHRIDGAAAFD